MVTEPPFEWHVIAPANLQSVIYFNAGLHRVTNSDRVGDMEPDICCESIHKDSVLGLLTSWSDKDLYFTRLELSFKKSNSCVQTEFLWTLWNTSCSLNSLWKSWGKEPWFELNVTFFITTFGQDRRSSSFSLTFCK